MSFDIGMDDIELKRLALELEQIEKEIQEFEQAENKIILSDNLETKMNQMIQEFELIDKKQQQQTSVKKIIRFAAVIMICVTVSLGVLTVNVDAFRIKLFDFIGKDHGEYMDVNIVEKGEISPEIKEKFPKEWDYVFYPMELPEGYNFLQTYGTTSINGLIFSKHRSKDSYISFDYLKIDGTNIAIDSENANVGKTKVNERDALYSSKDGHITLIWIQSGYEFTLDMDNGDLKEAKKIAENIAYINLKEF